MICNNRSRNKINQIPHFQPIFFLQSTKLDTNNRKIAVALNQAKNAAMDFGSVAGDMLAPFIENLAGKVESATEKLKNMDEGQKKTIVTIAAVVAAAGPVLSIVGKGISLVGRHESRLRRKIPC